MNNDGLITEPTDEQRKAWKSLCDRVSDIMKIHTRPFVTPLLHDVPGEPLRVGSGSYLDLSDGTGARTTVLTCEHVARHQPQQHQPNGSPTLLPLQGQLYADHDVTIDAATIMISNTVWAETAHAATPLAMNRFAERHAPVAGEVFFFRGLTDENSYVSGNVLDAIYTGYASQERPGTGDDQIFEIEWDPNKTQITQGTHPEAASRVRYDNAHGYSGSLVWNTRFVEMGCDLNRWRPTDAVVTGLLRRWDTSTMTLLVWRIEHLRRWLAKRACA